MAEWTATDFPELELPSQGAIRVAVLPWGVKAGAKAEEKAQVDPAELVREYSSLLYRVAYSVVRSAAEAEDVVQDAFVRVVQHRAELDGVREMRTWLVRIVWNLALDRKRRIVPEQMEDVFAAGMVSRELPADEQMVAARRFAEVFAAIDRLPHKEREALLLSVTEELSAGEIAAVLGKSESGVRALLFRARGHLRERLERSADFGGTIGRRGGER